MLSNSAGKKSYAMAQLARGTIRRAVITTLSRSAAKELIELAVASYKQRFGDGMPVTLKFANAVGEILTAGPIQGTPPLPFKHYI